MRKTVWMASIVAWSLHGGLAGAQQPAAAESRVVALTFDDLPFVPRGLEAKDVREKTEHLLAGLSAHHVPAIGFVNEGKLDGPEGPEAGTALLGLWLDAGFMLGNHSYSHLSL